MSLQQLAAFQQRLREDADLQVALSGVGAGELPEKMVNLGAEHGYPFTADEVRSMMQPAEGQEELSDEDLKSVTGGAFDAFSTTDLRTIDMNLRNLNLDERAFPSDTF